MQHDVFSIYTFRQLAIDFDATDLKLCKGKGLRSEDVANLAGAYAECDRAKRPMCRRMAIPTGNRHPRLRQPLFRRDHMHNPLRARPHIKKANAMFLSICF